MYSYPFATLGLKICLPLLAFHLEDYQGPTSTGLFKWMPDDDGELRPVTRTRMQNIERNPNYWDRVYEAEEKEKK